MEGFQGYFIERMPAGNTGAHCYQITESVRMASGVYGGRPVAVVGCEAQAVRLREELNGLRKKHAASGIEMAGRLARELIGDHFGRDAREFQREARREAEEEAADYAAASLAEALDLGGRLRECLKAAVASL